jgi:hypothetical protein
MPEPGWAVALVPNNMHSIKLMNVLITKEVRIFILSGKTFITLFMRVGCSILNYLYKVMEVNLMKIGS